MSDPYQVLLAMPGGPPSWGAACGMFRASAKHRINVTNCAQGWDNFNIPWSMAMNLAAEGKVTHFAMLHTDIAPEQRWLDKLTDELDQRDADMVSAIVPIKDSRGLTSCGIGNPEDNWHPLRRFTMTEVLAMPETWDAAAAGYPAFPLLLNSGCFVLDLRKPLFQATNDDGSLKCCFAFPRRIVPTENGWAVECESEDWYFSRMLFELGAKVYNTRKVQLVHKGTQDFTNAEAWGAMSVDEDTAKWWKPKQLVEA